MKTFESMEDAVKYIKRTLRIEELQYQYGSYSYGQKDNMRMIAQWENRKVVVIWEVWAKEKSEDDVLISVSNREIAAMAFLKLYTEKKDQSALRLAKAMILSVSMTLGIDERDWEVETALIFCGAHLSIGHRHNAYFNFEGYTKIDKKHLDYLHSHISNGKF